MERYLSLKDHVYNFITEEINKGNLKPESKINEQHICEILNVSRTPVREALIQLASDGFLENVPRKGFVIKGLSEQEALDNYMIIGALDGLAASLACKNIKKQEIDAMNHFIKNMDIAIDSNDLEVYHQQQKLFHQVYTDRCGNDSLIDMLNRIKLKLVKKSYGVVYAEKDIQSILRNTNNEHREIVELFENKDAKALDEYIREVHWRVDLAYMETL